jgi:hypothetical protein
LWNFCHISAQEIVEHIEGLPQEQRVEVIKRAMTALRSRSSKVIERFCRRLENPDISEEVWHGVEEAEDERLIDLDEALTELN